MNKYKSINQLLFNNYFIITFLIKCIFILDIKIKYLTI